MNRIASAAVLCLGVSGAAGGSLAAAPMNVHLTGAQVEARKDVDEATKNALKAKRDEAREARKMLERQLKDENGKKRETWPAEKQEALYQAEEAEALAEADYEYRKIDPKGISDAVKDVTESIQGKGIAGRKEHIVLVSSPAEADLQVEIMARRAGKTLPTQIKADRCFLLFSVAPGAKMDAAKFSRVPNTYRPKKFGLYAWRISAPKPEKQAFIFESYNGGGNEFGCQGAAANAAAGAVERREGRSRVVRGRLSLPSARMLRVGVFGLRRDEETSAGAGRGVGVAIGRTSADGGVALATLVTGAGVGVAAAAAAAAAVVRAGLAAAARRAFCNSLS